MANTLEVTKLAHCRFNNELWQKLSDKQVFKRQTRDNAPAIDYCMMKNINTGEELAFQWDLEVSIVSPDTLTTLNQVPMWGKFRYKGVVYSKVPADDKYNVVSSECRPCKIDEGKWIELML